MPYLLVKCHGVYYFSVNNQCGEYSNPATTQYSKMVFIPITLNEIHCDAKNEVWKLFEVQHLTKQM